MAGRSRVEATAAQVLELRALARSSDRGEADRARAILLSLEGWTSARIGRAFGVGETSVRRWRLGFGRAGVAGLRAHPPPGRTPERGLQALSVAEALLSQPVADRPNWTLPRLTAEIERRSGVRISTSRLSVLLRKKGAFAGADRDTA